MSTKETNIALISTIPDSAQQQIFVYLSEFCQDNPFKPKSAEEIHADLAKSRICYEQGDYEDFDDVLDEISEKYGL